MVELPRRNGRERKKSRLMKTYQSYLASRLIDQLQNPPESTDEVKRNISNAPAVAGGEALPCAVLDSIVVSSGHDAGTAPATHAWKMSVGDSLKGREWRDDERRDGGAMVRIIGG